MGAAETAGRRRGEAGRTALGTARCLAGRLVLALAAGILAMVACLARAKVRELMEASATAEAVQMRGEAGRTVMARVEAVEGEEEVVMAAIMAVEATVVMVAVVMVVVQAEEAAEEAAVEAAEEAAVEAALLAEDTVVAMSEAILGVAAMAERAATTEEEERAEDTVVKAVG